MFRCPKEYCPWAYQPLPSESLEDKLARVEREHAREQEQAGQKIVDEALERYAYDLWNQVKQQCLKQP
jgi:ABC-type phosphate transport system ATPase subunit